MLISGIADSGKFSQVASRCDLVSATLEKLQAGLRSLHLGRACFGEEGILFNSE